jgi:hypothetical protein
MVINFSPGNKLNTSPRTSLGLLKASFIATQKQHSQNSPVLGQSEAEVWRSETLLQVSQSEEEVLRSETLLQVSQSETEVCRSETLLQVSQSEAAVWRSETLLQVSQSDR